MSRIKELKELLDEILPGEYGTDYIIAGGFARDTFFNVQPKDVDVFMEFKGAEQLNEVLYRLEKNLLHYNTYGCEYGNSSIDDRMECVIKLPSNGIDLLFAKNPLMKAVDLLDYNINQCYIDVDDEVVYPNGITDELILKVPDISSQRQAYIEKKWETLRGQI